MDTKRWLNQTKAADIMVREVVTLKPTATLATAAGVLLHEQISGVPVVDSEGHCKGVLSVSDIIAADEKIEAQRKQIAESSFFTSNLALPASIYAERLAAVRDKVAPPAEQPIERFMTADIVSVGEDTALSVIVQDMVYAHIHRVVVLDAERRLVGIISTTDVLARLLQM